jgi:hypothetical protein
LRVAAYQDNLAEQHSHGPDKAAFTARHIHVVRTHLQHAPLVPLLLFNGDLALAPNPELAVARESAQTDGEQILFGAMELILGSH